MARSVPFALVACASAVIAAACGKDEFADHGRVGTPYMLHTPANFPPMPVPLDNPLTVEGVRLGRYLFYDRRLSGNNHQSCATCHSHSTSFTDGVSTSTGIDGINGTRNAMPLVNLAWQHFFFWDGRSRTLEQQVLEPVRNPVEMHDTWPHVMAKLQEDPAYPPLFEAAFGTPGVDSLLVAKAIAQFLRTLVSGNSPYDRWKRGEGTLSDDALAGYVLFTTEAGPVGQVFTLAGTNATVIGQGGADCFHCHTEGLFTDGGFHNNALDAVPADSGRALVTHDPRDVGRFKVPTLRNIGLTHPYMHDGRFFSLDQVLEHYNSGGVASATVDPHMKFTDPGTTMGLDQQMRMRLRAFLDALVDYDFINDPAIRDPGPP